MDGTVAGPHGGEKLVRGPRSHRILAELPELEVIELCFGPDFEGVEPHTHTDQIDTFYVLEGEAEFTVGTGSSAPAPERTWRLPSASSTASGTRGRASCGC